MITDHSYNNIPDEDVELLNSGFIRLPGDRHDCEPDAACFCPYAAHEGNHPCPDCCNNPIAQLIDHGLLTWRTANRFCAQGKGRELVAAFGIDPDEAFSSEWEWDPSKVTEPDRTLIALLEA